MTDPANPHRPRTPGHAELEATRLSGRDARQGEIVLRTRRRRIVFLSGLVGLVVLALVLALAGIAGR